MVDEDSESVEHALARHTATVRKATVCVARVATGLLGRSV